MTMGGWFESSQEQKFDPPDHTRQYYNEWTPHIMALGSTPAPDYQGMRVAPMNALQQTAGQMMTDRALYGDPNTNSARGGLLNITEGNAFNPYGGASNSFFEDMLSRQKNNMTDAFNRGTAATTNALAARGGGYGGSSHIQANAANAEALSDSIGGMESRMRNDQMNRAANIYQQDIGNVMQAAGMAPAFSMLDSQSFHDLMGYGNQLHSQLGKELDMSYNTYMDQYNHPFKMADWVTGKLSGLSGGYGEGWKTQNDSPMNFVSNVLGSLFGGR